MSELFSDGTPIDKQFYDVEIPSLESLGKKYVLTDYGIFDNGKVHTKELQPLIDSVEKLGGGVIVVPKGTYQPSPYKGFGN